MEFEKLVSPSLKDLFITHIEAMILSGELPVGQQLPPERQLAQSMGVTGRWSTAAWRSWSAGGF